MSDSDADPPRRNFWKFLLIAAVAGLLLLVGLAWYASSDSFQAMVRQRLVAELERITGGRVELGSVHTIPLRLRVDVRELTIHGREAAGEVPYAHVDRVVANLKLISVLGATFGFHSVILDRPVVHIVLYPDGSTNQPGPKLEATETPLARLFSLSLGRLEVHHGELLWNDREIPLDFEASDVSADVDYSVIHRNYSAKLVVGKIDGHFEKFRLLAWTADGHFILGRDRLEIRSLNATSGRSHLELSGTVANFLQPTITGKYDVTLDLAEAGAVLHDGELRRGILRASGNASWSGPQFSSIGRLALRSFEWRNQTLSLRADSLDTPFTLNPQRLVFSNIEAKLMGGEVNGDADVINWRNSWPPTRHVKTTVSEEQKGSVRLRLHDLSAQQIATAFSSTARPLHRLNLAGSAHGTIETHWRGSPSNAESEISLDVAAPKQPPRGSLPLNAHTHAIYRAASAELEVDEFNASARSSQVRGSGTLSTHAALKLSMNTNDLGEWLPVLNALGYSEVPATVHGRASLNGNATGRLSEIDFAGRLQAQAVEVVLPATSSAVEKNMRWDYVAADIQLSPQAFVARNGKLQHADAVASFDLKLGLDNRQFHPWSPFTASVQMHNADLARTMALAVYDYPVSGKMDFSVQASGTKAHPQGRGSVQVASAIVDGQPIQQFESRFTFNGNQVSLDSIHFAQQQAQVTGNGTYDLSSQAFRLNLNGEEFDLASFTTLQSGRVAVEGRMDFDAQSWGTLQEPNINAKIHLHDLTFDHERAGDFTFDAVTRGSELRITGRSQFKDSELAIDGNVLLRGDWPSTLNLHFNHVDVDALLRTYIRGRITEHSATAGDLQFRGPLLNPRELEVTGNVSDFFADIEHIQIRNNGPIRFAVSNQLLKIQQLRLIGEGTDLTVGGTARLSREQQVDLHADGHADLALIHSFNPDFTSSGAVAVNLTVAGTASRPALQGRLQINSGSIQYSDLPSALSDINGSLVFNQDRLQIESLTGHVGGGLVKFGGYATAYNRQLSFDLTLQGQDVRLRYPTGVSSMTNAQLRWSGTPSASTISGDATITKLAVSPGFDFGSYLGQAAGSSSLPRANPLLNRIRLDVHIGTTPELQMQTAALTLSGDADLQLRGTAARPVLLGRADIIEGQVVFNGTKYRLERGGITFSNPVTTTPVLDLQASTHLREYDITINLNGQLNKLNLSYHSEPPLPTADIISLLAPVGQTQEQFGQLQQSSQSPFVQQASSAVLAEAITSALSNRSQRLFGISHIKIDPQGLNTETTPTQATPLPAVTIEQQVRDNLTLTYTTNVAQRSQQIIQGEYNITRNLSIVGIRDYNGVVSFELRERRRKK